MLVSQIKNRLQEWLDERGLTYVDAAKATGLHYTTISRVAQNKADSVRHDVILKLCTKLEKRVEDFYYEEGDRDA